MNNPVNLFLLALFLGSSCFGQITLTDKLKEPLSDLHSASAATVGMSQDSISKLVELINSNPPNDFRGMVVIKDNKLVVEEYFNTYWRETIHDVRSAGKGVTALLLGIAIDKGLVKSVEQSIYDFFRTPEFGQPVKDTHRDIKIKHLLSMSSGLSADDNDEQSPGHSTNWLATDDWVNFAIGLPMKFKPGENFVYNDVCPMLIGAIIEEASGQRLSDFAREHLFTPIGIRDFYWYTAPNGRTGPMGNLYLSTLDFARIGLLVLNKGKWQGKQIVSADWIDAVSTKRFDISGADPFASGYGYFWFLNTKKEGGKTFHCLYASGNGGNLLFIVRDENLVVSLTSSAYGQGYGHQRTHNIFSYILRSIKHH